MKLAILIPGFQANEHDWCIPAFTNLARELSRSMEVHVFALRYPHRRATYRVGDVRVHALGGGALWRGRRLPVVSLLRLWRNTLAAVSKEHWRSPFDAVLGIWATESGWLATRIAGRLGVPSAVHLAGGELVWLPDIRYGNQRKGLAKVLVGGTLRRADLFTVPSRPMEELLRGRGSGIDGGVGNRMGMRRRPSPVPQRRRQCSEVRRYALGVDTRMFSYRPPAQGRGSRPFTFLTVGSLVPVKNHKGMLLALAEVRRRAPNADVRLQIAGAGPLRRPLEQVASRLELEGYVDFLGEVRHEQLPDVVGLADCFLLGSYHEAQCMALLEAMACGRPWVAPPVGSAVDCADFGQGGDPSGVLARGQGGGDLADAMLRVLDLDSPALEAMGLAARSLIETHYELGTQAARLADLLAALTQDEPIVTIQSASA